jgi:hypothetical protein
MYSVHLSVIITGKTQSNSLLATVIVSFVPITFIVLFQTGVFSCLFVDKEDCVNSALCCFFFMSYFATLYQLRGARGSIVVKALGYQPKGHGFKTR